jgi:hypothetical protein
LLLRALPALLHPAGCRALNWLPLTAVSPMLLCCASQATVQADLVLPLLKRTVTLPLTVANLTLRCHTRITARPLLESPPFAGSVVLSLLEPPLVDFDLPVKLPLLGWAFGCTARVLGAASGGAGVAAGGHTGEAAVEGGAAPGGAPAGPRSAWNAAVSTLQRAWAVLTGDRSGGWPWGEDEETAEAQGAGREAERSVPGGWGGGTRWAELDCASLPLVHEALQLAVRWGSQMMLSVSCRHCARLGGCRACVVCWHGLRVQRSAGGRGWGGVSKQPPWDIRHQHNASGFRGYRAPAFPPSGCLRTVWPRCSRAEPRSSATRVLTDGSPQTSLPC